MVTISSVMVGDGLNLRHLLQDNARCLLQLPDLIERLVLVGMWLVALYRAASLLWFIWSQLIWACCGGIKIPVCRSSSQRWYSVVPFCEFTDFFLMLQASWVAHNLPHRGYHWLSLVTRWAGDYVSIRWLLECRSSSQRPPELLKISHPQPPLSSRVQWSLLKVIW